MRLSAYSHETVLYLKHTRTILMDCSRNRSLAPQGREPGAERDRLPHLLDPMPALPTVGTDVWVGPEPSTEHGGSIFEPSWSMCSPVVTNATSSSRALGQGGREALLNSHP